MSRSRASTEAGRRRASKATGRTRSTQAQGGRPGELRGPGAEADGDQEQPVTLDHSERAVTPHREAAALQASRDQITPQAAPLAAPSPHRPQAPVRSAARTRCARSRAIGRGSWRYRLAVVAIVGRNRRRRLHVLAARLLAGRGRQRRRGRASPAATARRSSGELTKVAEDMTTLHVDTARLERGGAGLPDRRRDQRRPNFPHGMRIEVTERPPAMLVSAGGEQVPAAADGTLLRGVEVSDDDHLPVLELGKLPPGRQPRRRPARSGARPGRRPGAPAAADREDRRRRRVRRSRSPCAAGSPCDSAAGAGAADKWAAAAAVLADPKLDGLTYVDVRVPERAAAGGASPAPGMSPSLQHRLRL